MVGLALTRQHGDECWIDSLLLSCRVIGRGIDSAILAQLAAHAAQQGARWLVGEYIETKKNVPCRDFYPDHGFTEETAAGAEGAIVYRLNLADRMPVSPAWLKLEGNESYEFSTSTAVTA